MHKILVEGINIYAFHGCLEEEGRIGGNYVVDVAMDTDYSSAAETDELRDTVDYVTVYEIVKKEMGIRSKLIEHVAKRISDNLHKTFPALISSEVKLTKIKPPIHGDVARTSVVYVHPLKK